MASADNHSVISSYNDESFTRSESAGKSGEFKNALRAGEEAHPTLSYAPLRVIEFVSRRFVVASTCCSSSAASRDRRLWARSRP